MKLKPRDWIFLLIVIVVVGGLAGLSYFGKHPQVVSTQCTVGGKPVTTATTREQCLQCHHPETGQVVAARLPVRHPQKWKDEKFPCIGCHQVREARAGLTATSRQVARDRSDSEAHPISHQ